ncbi:hypothetical protein B0T10DRAFT_493725 [Thelonectria olida]|uniref:Uncharacterized protein n=1 Tax=Thelonectria olida TaxID=1576542 RepID=A0A9P8VXB6_9HYPO|nr:hypothetical protein B0T10DRAFT_493725 [Thelonectria olida]
MDLPILTSNHAPIRHADCCLSLSLKLLEVLTDVCGQNCNRAANRKQTVLSIGSGTGLLEALLLEHFQSQSARQKQENIRIEGVEVQQLGTKAHLNKYLPDYAAITVRGTWEISPRMRDSDVSILMFTYPRQAALVTQYAQAALQPDSGIMLMVWLGPVADWDEFEPCFCTSTGTQLDEHGFKLDGLMQGDEAGIGDYEMMAVFRR